jgi:hypothetical protein
MADCSRCKFPRQLLASDDYKQEEEGKAAEKENIVQHLWQFLFMNSLNEIKT